MLANTDFTIIKAAATCVAAICVIELPAGMWNGVLDLLQNNANSDDLNIRLASVLTLGFICEDIDPKYLSADQLNLILPAVLMNVIPDQIMLTQIAMKAFARAAPITEQNFLVPEQKDYIMQKVFEASKINDEDVLSSVMEGLNDIVRVNYDYMFPYIGQIGQLTIDLINSEHDRPAKLAIEVWSTISEVEQSRLAVGKPTQSIIQNCFDSVL